jgi:hypothetical protein
MTSTKVLTLYLCKDKRYFREKNFLSVKNQEGVDQRVFIISAKPIKVDAPNIVVPTKSDWLLPIRVSFSINIALKIIELKYNVKLRDFDYIFKVDSDALLPSNYVKKLVSQPILVAGIGPALIISVPFFIKALSKKYPVTYCDDGFVTAKSIALGLWPRSLRSDSLIVPPVRFDSKKEFAYGIEYYKWGLSPLLLALVLMFSRVLRLRPHEKRSLRAHVANIAGYIWASLHGIEKYSFWQDYRRMRNRHFAESVLRALSYLKKLMFFAFFPGTFGFFGFSG